MQAVAPSYIAGLTRLRRSGEPEISRKFLPFTENKKNCRIKYLGVLHGYLYEDFCRAKGVVRGIEPFYQ